MTAVGTAEHAGWQHVAGTSPPLWQHAPPLAVAHQQLREVVSGRIVAGHNLAKALQVLGLEDHPAEQ